MDTQVSIVNRKFIDMDLEELTDDAIDWPKGDEYIDLVRELKLNLTAKSDECELLKIRLNETKQDIDTLNKELNQMKMMMFEVNEGSKRNQEESEKSKKLEEKFMKLMSDHIKLAEENESYRLAILQKYLDKSNAINNLECLYWSGALTNDLEKTKSELNRRMAELSLANARCRNLEEENSIKDKCVTELRKTLDDAKVSHKHEINVLEEYIDSLKNTIASYEKFLTSHK